MFTGLIETLGRVAVSMSWRNKTRDPVVLMVEFGDSAVVFEVSVWIDDPWVLRRARSDLNEAIWWTFKEKGIVIAFPQMDVHLDPEVLSLRALGEPATSVADHPSGRPSLPDAARALRMLAGTVVASRRSTGALDASTTREPHPR